MDRRPAADDARPSGSGGGAKAPARSSVGGSGQGGEGGSRHGSRGPDGRRASEPDRAGRDTRGPDVRRDTREGRDRDWDRERGRDRGRDREPHPRPSSAAGVRSPPGAPRLPASASPRPGASTPPDRRPPSGGGLRHSSLLADAARLVREKEAREAAAAKQARQESNGGTPPPATEGKRKGRWIDDDPEAAPATPAGGSPESSEAEDGELPQPAPAKRQRHEPVVWKPSDAATGDKSPGGGGQLGDLRAAALRRRDGVGSSSRLDTAGARSQSPPSQPVSRAAATAAPAPGANLPVRPPSSLGRGDPPRSAAEILAAELDAFRQTAGSDLEFDPDAPAAMKASPSASEGGDTPATAQPAAGREEGAGSEEEDGGGRASRWHDEDAADEPEVVSAEAENAVADVNTRELAGPTLLLPSVATETCMHRSCAQGKEAAEAENAVAALNARELASLDGSLPSDGEPGSDEDVQEGHVRGVSMLRECRSVEEFERLNRISEGTYGVVYRAKEKATGRIVALKKVKMDKERDGFPLTAIREVNILLSFHHASIVDVSEVVVGKSLDSVFMVMEFMEHDLKQLMEDMKNPFSIAEVKALMWQLFDGIEYLHDNWVLHRDLKTSNILYNNRGELKICDFGLARQYGSPLKPYTHMVVTLWYRCPELLLGAKEYSTAVDLWSLGCIMAELLSKEVLFDGRSELDQLDKIFKTLGSPNERIWPGLAKLPNARKIKFPDQPYNTLRSKFPPLSALGGRPGLSDLGFDLMNRLLTLDPEKRITAKEALNHEWFREKPLAKDRALMPTFPSRTEGMRQHNQKSPDPRIVETRRAQLSKAQDKGGLFSFPPK